MSKFIDSGCIIVQTSSCEITEVKTPGHKIGSNLQDAQCPNCGIPAKCATRYFCQIFIFFMILTVIAQALFFVFIYQRICSLENQLFAHKDEIRQLKSRVELQDERQLRRHHNDARHHAPDRAPERNSDLGVPSWHTSRKLLRRQRRGRGCHCDNAIQRAIQSAISSLNLAPPPRPGIHLKGWNEGGLSQIEEGAEILFLWRGPDGSTGGGISSDERYIEIHQTGLYLVYSQITIAGRRYQSGSSMLDPSCGHETIRIRGQDRTVLLSSRATQTNWGRNNGVSSSGNPMYPLDTLSHQGVFLLEQNDKLAVRTPSSSHDRFAINSPHNYFGAAMLSN